MKSQKHYLWICCLLSVKQSVKVFCIIYDLNVELEGLPTRRCELCLLQSNGFYKVGMFVGTRPLASLCMALLITISCGMVSLLMLLRTAPIWALLLDSYS